METAQGDHSPNLSQNRGDSSVASGNMLPITAMLTDISTNSDSGNQRHLIRVRRKHALPSEKRLCFVCGSPANGFVHIIYTYCINKYNLYHILTYKVYDKVCSYIEYVFFLIFLILFTVITSIVLHVEAANLSFGDMPLPY